MQKRETAERSREGDRQGAPPKAGEDGQAATPPTAVAKLIREKTGGEDGAAVCGDAAACGSWMTGYSDDTAGSGHGREGYDRDMDGGSSDVSTGSGTGQNQYGVPYHMEDKLTHMYGRAGFFAAASWMIAGHEPEHYILTVINIDDFKAINDTYGDRVGDEVLIHVARCLYDCLMDEDAICARMTADNFAVLYPSAYASSPNIEAAHVRASAPMCIMQRLHIRVGRYIVKDKSLPVSNMYERVKLAADAGYGRYGDNIHYYMDEMRERMLRRQHIQFTMVDALKSGEFEVWLQPQYDIAAGRIAGAEALTRWRHLGAFISPAEFIPIFEKSGFIWNLDTYIWEECCRLIRKHLDEDGSAVSIAVNISRVDVQSAAFPQVLIDMIEKYRLPKELLRLEITESAFSAHENVISKVNSLIDMGYCVDIDDFGSGYSSLNLLKDVPASVLKMDLGFLGATKYECRSQVIIASVVHMAELLGMDVIAEGVNTAEEADFLKKAGCRYAQGYYYARPMPVEKFEELVRAQRQMQR